MAKAKFNGFCSECGGKVNIGDEIGLFQGGNWVHKECAEEAQAFWGTRSDEDDRSRPVCPVCNVVRPCFCG